MSWTKETWQNEVARHLFELANIPFQKELWLAKVSGYQSDFTELVNGLSNQPSDDLLESDPDRTFRGKTSLENNSLPASG